MQRDQQILGGLMRIRNGSLAIRVFGHVLFWSGGLNYAYHFITVHWYSFPQNMGISLGFGAITLLGLVAIAVASCLKNLEERLDRIEGQRSGTGDATRQPN
jgi:hypothetical protein